MITTTSKKFIKIQGLWWVVMQYHIYLNVNILSIHHIKNERALLIITYKVKHRLLYFWFHSQYADISSEVRFMKKAALKNTLYHGWFCWRKMYNRYLQYQHLCAADMLFSQGIKQHRNQQLHFSTETAGFSTEGMILKNIKQLSKRKNSSWKSPRSGIFMSLMKKFWRLY